MESTSEKQKTLVGVFHDLPETLKAWEVVKKIASGNGEVNFYYMLIDYRGLKLNYILCFKFWPLSESSLLCP